MEHWVYLATGEFQPFMKRMPHDRESRLDPVSNDVFRDSLHDSFEADPEAFYARRSAAFARKASGRRQSRDAINEAQRKMLEEIRHIFVEHETDYRIVVSPVYDQVPLSTSDLAVLQDLFGIDRVHDFSGANEFTSDKRNFSDPDHAWPSVGREIMQRIYGRSAGGDF